MRILLLTLLALFATPAFAQGWQQYDNARFGYSIAIPPGFVGQGESDYGDGQTFLVDGKPIELLVWANSFMEADFEAEVAAAIGYSAEAGWSIAEQTITPRWASFSGIDGSRALHQRLVALCDGQSYAAFRLQYAVADTADLASVIAQMEQSLRGNC